MEKEQCNYCNPDMHYIERKPLINGCIFVKIEDFNKECNVLCNNPHPLSGVVEYARFYYCPIYGRKLKTD